MPPTNTGAKPSVPASAIYKRSIATVLLNNSLTLFRSENGIRKPRKKRRRRGDDSPAAAHSSSPHGVNVSHVAAKET
jgi:hypothetical protein